MRRALIGGCLALWAIGASDAGAASLLDFQVLSLTNGAVTQLPGRLYVPPAAASSLRPLILFLHGAGESGTNNSAQVNGNIDNLLAEAKRRGAYLYAPQTNGGWDSATITGRVATMVNRALTEQNVDASRVYVTGLSMGGGGTWNMLNRYGDVFAAGVPICAVTPSNDFRAVNMLDEAIWAFHARSDTTVNVASTRNVFSSIVTAAGLAPPASYPTAQQLTEPEYAFDGLNVKYTDYRGGGHTIWGRVYNTPAVYEWMFSFTNVPEPSTGVLIGAGLAAIAGLRGRRPARIQTSARTASSASRTWRSATNWPLNTCRTTPARSIT
jgi:predicted peptidase